MRNMDVFFLRCPRIAQISGRFKMVYIGFAIDPRAYWAVHHFETALQRILV